MGLVLLVIRLVSNLKPYLELMSIFGFELVDILEILVFLMFFLRCLNIYILIIKLIFFHCFLHPSRNHLNQNIFLLPFSIYVYNNLLYLYINILLSLFNKIYFYHHLFFRLSIIYLKIILLIKGLL